MASQQGDPDLHTWLEKKDLLAIEPTLLNANISFSDLVSFSDKQLQAKVAPLLAKNHLDAMAPFFVAVGQLRPNLSATNNTVVVAADEARAFGKLQKKIGQIEHGMTTIDPAVTAINKSEKSCEASIDENFKKIVGQMAIKRDNLKEESKHIAAKKAENLEKKKKELELYLGELHMIERKYRTRVSVASGDMKARSSENVAMINDILRKSVSIDSGISTKITYQCRKISPEQLWGLCGSISSGDPPSPPRLVQPNQNDVSTDRVTVTWRFEGYRERGSVVKQNAREQIQCFELFYIEKTVLDQEDEKEDINHFTKKTVEGGVDCVLQPLKEDTEYCAMIRARNFYGPGPFSSYLTFKTTKNLLAFDKSQKYPEDTHANFKSDTRVELELAKAVTTTSISALHYDKFSWEAIVQKIGADTWLGFVEDGAEIELDSHLIDNGIHFHDGANRVIIYGNEENLGPSPVTRRIKAPARFRFEVDTGRRTCSVFHEYTDSSSPVLVTWEDIPKCIRPVVGNRMHKADIEIRMAECRQALV